MTTDPTITVASVVMPMTSARRCARWRSPRRDVGDARPEPDELVGLLQLFAASLFGHGGLREITERVPGGQMRFPCIFPRRETGRPPSPHALCPRPRCVALGLPGADGRAPRARRNGSSRAARGAATVSVDGRTTWGFAGGGRPRVRPVGLLGAARLRSRPRSTRSTRTTPMDTRPRGGSRPRAALAGLTYTIDILRLVPYADLQLGRAAGRAARWSRPRIVFVTGARAWAPTTT